MPKPMRMCDRGVSAAQDVRYVNKEKKAMAAMKFPKELDAKVCACIVQSDMLKCTSSSN